MNAQAPVRVSPYLAAILIAYAAAAHTVDCLATQGVTWIIDWDVFRWRPASWAHSSSTLLRVLSTFDIFKLLIWLVLPMTLCVRSIDWSWFNPRALRRSDVWLLAGSLVCAVVAVLSIQFFPGLREDYRSVSHGSLDERMIFMGMQFVWLGSWLGGWEFLHRYVLIYHIKKAWPALAWPAVLVIVPLLETLYHLGQTKDLVEIAAVPVFSLVLCAWTLHRENVVGPALAHLFVEVALVIFLVMA